MGPALYSKTKHVIYNVYKFFRDRKKDPNSAEHRDDINVYKTVAAAVGVSHRTVLRVVKEANSLQKEHGRIVFEDPKNRRKEEKDLDDAIKEKFLEFIRRKEKPTINKIRIELLEDGVLLCSYDYMKTQLKRLGFRFRPARPRLKKVKDEEETEAGSSGYLLEHITVKVEPLEPGFTYDESGNITNNDLHCDLQIKLEENEFNDND